MSHLQIYTLTGQSSEMGRDSVQSSLSFISYIQSLLCILLISHRSRTVLATVLELEQRSQIPRKRGVPLKDLKARPWIDTHWDEGIQKWFSINFARFTLNKHVYSWSQLSLCVVGSPSVTHPHTTQVDTDTPIYLRSSISFERSPLFLVRHDIDSHDSHETGRQQRQWVCKECLDTPKCSTL